MSYKIEINGLEIKTADGENLLGSDFKVEIKELDELNRTFWAIASDEGEDRDNDIIRVEGWDLKQYKKSPRGLWMHNYFEHPHFKTEKIKIDKNEKKLLFKPKFDTHDRAQLTWNQYKNGFLDDFSVGFGPGEFNYRDENNRWMGGREFVRGHKLYEISSVTIPSNPNAQILRSIGLVPPDQISLETLGYSNEFSFIDEKNQYWYPILRNMSAYKNPKIIKLNDGISVVRAFPRYEKEDKELIIGYNFDKDNFKSLMDILNWLDDQSIIEPIKRFYKIGFDENNEFIFSIEEEKAIDDEEDKFCTCDEFIALEDNADKCKGCGGRKPKSQMPCGEDDEDKILIPDEFIEKDIYIAEIEKPYPNEHACRLNDPGKYDKFARKNCAQKHNDKCIDVIYGIKSGKSEIQALRYKKSIWDTSAAKSHCSSRNGSFEAASSSSFDYFDFKTLDELLQKFDNIYEDKVKTIVTEVDAVKIEIKEIKKLLSLYLEEIKNLKESSENNILDLSELDLSLVPPVSKDEDDSNEIHIDSEIFKSEVPDIIVESLKKVFAKILMEEKDKFSGKLEN